MCGQKIDKKLSRGSPKGRQCDFGLPAVRSFWARWGPSTVRKKDRFDRKTATLEKGSRHAVGPKARRIIIATIWEHYNS